MKYTPGVGVAGREGGADGFNAGVLAEFFSPSAGGVGVVALLPGFETTNVTRPSVRFNKFAAWKTDQKLYRVVPKLNRKRETVSSIFFKKK